ncbi:MAG: glycosyltransferase family 4 protein [bacterium]
MKVIYVRFQDFDTRFYLTSERELVRAFNDMKVKAELVGVGKKKDEPDFVTLFSAFEKNHLINKILISLYLLKYVFSDAVVIFDNLSYLMAVPLLLFRKVLSGRVRVLMDVRGIPVETYKIYEYRKYNSSLLFARKFMDGVTFITEGTRILTERMIKRKFINYRIYPSGFNDEIMKPVERNLKLSEALEINKDEFVVFYHGSISQNRGVKELVEAVEILKKKYKVRLLVIGGGDSEIVNMIKREKGNIFIDPVCHEEIPQYISIADVCVSPLPDILWWRVASSLKVMEYMACGKPIALTRMKAHTDVVPDGGEGVSYFEKVTPEDIAAAIEKIIVEKDLWHAKKDVMVNHARSKFSYRVLASELLEYYNLIKSAKFRTSQTPVVKTASFVKTALVKKKKNVRFVAYTRIQNIGRKFYLTSERELIRSLNNMGLDSELIAYGKGNEPDFVTLINSPLMNPTMIKIKIMLYLLKYRGKSGVLMFDKLAYLTAVPLIIYRKIFGGSFKLMFDLRSIPVETKKGTNIRKFKNALLFSHAFFDGATFITEGTKKICENLIRKRFVKCEIYPSGFNSDIMKPLPTDGALRRSIGIEDNESLIFYHGSLSKNRGLIELNEAVKILKKKHRVKLLVIGAGDEKIVEMLKRENVFMDPVNYEEIPKYIALSDVCVSPLPDIVWWRVASALKVMEYMACGKPIALTRMKAHTDVVPDGGEGVSYFEKVTPEDIAAAIEKILNNKSAADEDAKKLRKHAIENYTYDSIAAKLLDFYETFYNG